MSKLKIKGVLIGPAGAGKGTLAEILKKNGFEVYTTSEVLRENNVEIPKNGELVSDDTVISSVKNKIVNSTGNLFLDGFPRSVRQAKALFESNIEVERVIVLDCPIEVLLERSKDRVICKNCRQTYTLSAFKWPIVEGICDNCKKELIYVKRTEDTPENTQKRYDDYKKTEPSILEVFENHGVKIVKIDTSKHYSLTDVLN